MVLMASAATFSFFTITLPSLESTTKSTKLGGGLAKIRGVKSKQASSSDLQVKGNGRASTHGIGNTVATSDMLINPIGELVQDGLAFRQNYYIRSYEVGADCTASIETLMNLLQETLLNRARATWRLAHGFGYTPKMFEKNLIWVTIQIKIVVDRYPMWGDIVQVDNWISTSRKKNAFQFDCLMRDYQTGEILQQASSVFVMMNKLTRRLCKVPEEVRGEIEPFILNSAPFLGEDSRIIPKLDDNTADHICAGLGAKRNDADVNQHVNNVKYVGWILESVPQSILESHEMAAMTLEYKRECGRDSKVKSLTAVSDAEANNQGHSGHIECVHLLRLENGTEVVRGRTAWRPKLANNYQGSKEF